MYKLVDFSLQCNPEDFHRLLEILMKEGYTLTYRGGQCIVEKQGENPYNPQSQVPDYFLNNKSELVQEDYIFEPAAARGAGSKVERLPTEEEARVACDAMELNELEKMMRNS